MRVDVVTIFPDYLAPLSLSLPGRAQESGLLDVQVHDLRAWTRDRHHTVDDTPYGGGAGMVMKPEPWGQALDAIVADNDGSDGSDGSGDRAGGDRPVLVVPTPSGERFTQKLAAELAGRAHLVVACGRYEGIDQRVVDDARARFDVREVSIGDYVLNGGEVAALVVVEAVVRLLPGFMGNPESLVEESHGEHGLLEYPVYTKPASWRGHDVPPVLLSGDHARIATWRHEQSVRRTAARRPDLLHPSQALENLLVAGAQPGDSGELLTLQRACGAQERRDRPGPEAPVPHEGLEDVRAWSGEGGVLVLRSAGRLVGAVRGRLLGRTWTIDRLMVAPDLEGRGLERLLLEQAEAAAPPEAEAFELLAGAGAGGDHRVYRRAGYRPRGEAAPGVLRLTRRRP